MSFIDRVKSPGEIYVLLVTFIFTEQFDRNLDLEAVEEGAIKNFLEISHSFLDALTNHMQPIGAAFFVYAFILIALRLSGKKVRRLVDVLAIFLAACWTVELVIMNLLLVAPIKSPVLLIVELLRPECSRLARERERELMPSDIDVYCQENAWYDTATTLE